MPLHLFLFVVVWFLIQKQKIKSSKSQNTPQTLPLSLYLSNQFFFPFSFRPAMLIMPPALFPPPWPTYPSPPVSFLFFQPDHDRLPAQPSLAKTTSSQPTSLLPSLTHRHPGPTCQSFPLPPTDNMANRTATHPQPPPLFPPPSTELSINTSVRTHPTAPPLPQPPPHQLHRAIMATDHRAPHHGLTAPLTFPLGPKKWKTPSPLPIRTSPPLSHSLLRSAQALLEDEAPQLAGAPPRLMSFSATSPSSPSP
jgi:hypothetical protein